MIYDYTTINDTASRVFKTAQSLQGGAFTAVELTSEGLVTAGASSAVLGLLTGEAELPLGAGEDLTVQIQGGGLWLAGEEISAGDFLSSGSGGLAQKAKAGNFIFAQALSSGASGTAVEVLITRGGYAK